MNPFEERYTAWVDGQLPAAEKKSFEEELANHPELAGDQENLLRLGSLLRTYGSAPALDNPDFFNHQLLTRLSAETPRDLRPARPSPGFFARLAWAGAFLFLLAAALFHFIIPENPVGGGQTASVGRIIHARAGEPGITATAFNADDGETAVIWLEGLEYIPATHRIQ